MVACKSTLPSYSLKYSLPGSQFYTVKFYLATLLPRHPIIVFVVHACQRMPYASLLRLSEFRLVLFNGCP